MTRDQRVLFAPGKRGRTKPEETIPERAMRDKMLVARREAKELRAVLVVLSNAALTALAMLDAAREKGTAPAANALELANDIARRHLGAGITSPRRPVR